MTCAEDDILGCTPGLGFARLPLAIQNRDYSTRLPHPDAVSRCNAVGYALLFVLAALCLGSRRASGGKEQATR